MTRAIRVDLTLGTAYGLALGALLWTLVLAPPTGVASALMLLALAAAAGACATISPHLALLRPGYACAVTALLVAGPALSCATGAVSALAARARVAPGSRHRPELARAGFRATREVLALALAAAALAAVEPAAGTIVPRLALHAAIYAAACAVLPGLVRLGCGLGLRARTVLRHAALALPGCAAGGLLGLATSLAAEDGAVAGPLLFAGIACSSVWAVERLHAERRKSILRHRAAVSEIRREVTGALARTLEERDPSIQDHLHRVHRLCTGIAARLDLPEAETETLAAAALLHDIGKVAVPESILHKPGRLTDEELRRVQRHPIVGAEIVRCLPFRPSPAPIVRHHHERWDGRGYPDGLSGREIPLGARILAAADCYDALTSDRPYRRALPPREAQAFLIEESGHAFDPDVVEALLDYLDARAPGLAETRRAPDEATLEARDPRHSLITAQRELETLYDISRAMGRGLDLDEFLTLAGCRLASLVPFDSLVAYFVDGDGSMLRARFAVGRAADKLRLMTIPVGERLSGRAAAERHALIGRGPAAPVERDGARSDLEDWADDPDVAPLSAALASPMVAEAGLVGVLTLYGGADREFTGGERRLVSRVAGCVAQVARREGAGPAVSPAGLTDPLTGVPNARFLWLESAHRMGPGSEGFGMVAFRVAGLDGLGETEGHTTVDRVLCEVARRFAACCRDNETLVRFGHDLFVVLTPIAESGELIARGHELALAVERPALFPARAGSELGVRVDAAHASHPQDGPGLDAILSTLDRRLALAAGRGRNVVPFRAPRSAGTGARKPASSAD